MGRRLGIVAVVLFASAGCGGDAGDSVLDDNGAAAATTTEMISNDAELDETITTSSNDDEAGEEEGSGPSTATVTLGDQTYGFSSEGALVAQCLTDLFGIFSVQLPLDDGGDGNVGIIALYPDTDPDVVEQVNSVRVAIGDEDWVADEDDLMFESSDELEEGMSQVDSVEVEGRTVRGTATFVRQLSLFSGDGVETMTGTFEATCGEERTS